MPGWHVWIILCLTLLLASCSSVKTVTVPQIERQYPPAVLMRECPAPADPVNPTWRDIAALVLDYRAALEDCNTDKAKLRAWSTPSSD
jgi:hypothetical protein